MALVIGLGAFLIGGPLFVGESAPRIQDYTILVRSSKLWFVVCQAPDSVLPLIRQVLLPAAMQNMVSWFSIAMPRPNTCGQQKSVELSGGSGFCKVCTIDA